MGPEGDALSAIAWGARRHAVVIVVAVVVLGIVVPEGLRRSQPEQYDAQAQVGLVTPLALPNLDPLPRTAESVFTNGAIAAAVRTELGLPRTDPVIPRRVELVAPQDNVVLTVVGHGATPEEATNAANTAAGTFVAELNKYQETVGTFAVQQSATPPTTPRGTIGELVLVLVGVLAGLVVGLAVVMALLVWRRPVLSRGSAARAVGAPVLATLEMDPLSPEIRGLRGLCRAVLRRDVSVVHVTGVASARAERRRLRAALQTAISASPATIPNGDAAAAPLGTVTVVEALEDPRLAAAGESAVTLFVVPLGAAETAVRREAELHADQPDVGVVLVRLRNGRWRRARRLFSDRGRRRRRKQTVPDTLQPEAPSAPPTTPAGQVNGQRPETVGSKDSFTTSQ